MKRQILTTIVLTFVLSAAWPVCARAGDRWEFPADTALTGTTPGDSIVTLPEALRRVRRTNPGFPALDYHRLAAEHRVDQSTRWTNPELEIELEEIGWDSPGFSESEIAISISQEFELLGQRGARKSVAQAELDAVELRARISAFELYLETRKRYFDLVYAQEEYCLTEMAVTLAERIADNTGLRIKEGAALQSELLLAQMELQRSKLSRAESSRRLFEAKIRLAALWNDNSPERLVVALLQPDLERIRTGLVALTTHVDSTGEMVTLQARSRVLDRERRLARAEARPGITLTGGFKRMRADGSDSFILGLSLPLPLFDRSRGTKESLKARLKSMEYQIESVRRQTTADLQSAVARLNQLIESYETIDSELLPTAEEAFRSLEETYEAGRLPYSNILEAGRSLIELRFEHNDILYSIYEQIISIEHTTGLRIDVEQP